MIKVRGTILAILATIVLALCVNAYAVSPQFYSVSTGPGTKVKLAVDPTTGKIAVGLLNGSAAVSYAISSAAGILGTHTLNKSGTYGKTDSASTLFVDILSFGTGASITVASSDTSGDGITYSMAGEEVDLLRSPCYTPSHTGACDEIHSNEDWWRCYWCCYFLGCSGGGNQ